MIGGGVAALVAVVGLVIAMSLGGSETHDAAPKTDAADTAAAAPDAAPAAGVAPGSPEFAALVAQASAGIGCSWLSLGDAGADAVRFSGAAAVPAVAQTQLAGALEAGGAKVPTIDFANVLTFPQSSCATLDALRAGRGGTVRIATPQTTYEVRNEPIDSSDAAAAPRPHAKVLLQVSSAAPLRYKALIFFNDQSAPAIWDNEKTAERVARYKGTQTPQGVTFTLPYELVNGRPESDGVAVISSDQPLPANITTFDDGWPQRFMEGAKAGRWHADAVWFRVEDRQPG